MAGGGEAWCRVLSVTQARDDRREILSKMFLFSELAPRDLELLADYTTRKQVAARSELFHKGDAAGEAYGIVSGRLKAVSRSPEGKEVTFSIMERGEVFGEVALLSGKARTATVIALEASELLVIGRRELMHLLEREPKLAVNCMNALATRLLALTERMEETLFLRMPSRLARKLLELANAYGAPSGEEIRLQLKLSQAELGNLIGTSRESVNKQLGLWEQDGVVRRDGRELVLLDSHVLEDVADAIDV